MDGRSDLPVQLTTGTRNETMTSSDNLWPTANDRQTDHGSVEYYQREIEKTRDRIERRVQANDKARVKIARLTELLKTAQKA
jgi:hypothetical protein